MQLEFDLAASLVIFPLSRRRGVVLEAASTIIREDDEGAARYWRQLIRDLTDPLLVAGIPRHVVQAEAVRFSDAVQQEIWRIGQVGGAL